MTIRSITLFLILALPGAAPAAQIAALALPDFRSLQGRAVDSVDLTLGPWLLHAAGGLLDDSDADGAAMKKLLTGIRSIQIRSLTFDHDRAYSESDLEAVRNQLAGPNWLPIITQRSRKDGERVDIRLRLEDQEVRGFALVATQPREFTIVYIVGSLNPADLPRLLHGLHLPAVDADDGSAQR